MVHQVLLCVMLLSTPGVAPAEEMPVKSPPHGEPAAPHGQIVSLLTGGLNALEPFTPKLSISRSGRGRHVPMLAATAPWAANQNVPVEVPEYVHGHTAERRRGAFLFAGRPLGVAAKIGGVRYASKTPPAWRKTADGRFVLDNELAAGLTIRFRVIPHDRMLEVRVGLTNEGTLSVQDVWTQLCYKGTGSSVLAERHPGWSFMLIEGKLKSWDAAGQDLAWLDAYREPRAKNRFRMSCFFMAYTGKGSIEGKLGKVRGGSPVFSLGKRIDVPAIAKLDEAKRRGVIIYSPSAGKAFYNVLQPCFHADPSIGTVKPNTTGWSQTYMLYVAGDVEGMMKKLAAALLLIKNVRKTQTRYPNGRVVYYNYYNDSDLTDGQDAINDPLNRVRSIASAATATDGTPLAASAQYAAFTYLGEGRIVKESHPDVTGGLNLTYGTGGTYGGGGVLSEAGVQRRQYPCSRTPDPDREPGADAMAGHHGITFRRPPDGVGRVATVEVRS